MTNKKIIRLLFFICTIILTITTKIGFVIEGVYFDIKGLALCAFLGVLTVFVSMGFKIFGLVIGYFLYVKLLCKVGEVELMPDAILASIIGCTIWGIIIFDKISTLGIVWF